MYRAMKKSISWMLILALVVSLTAVAYPQKVYAAEKTELIITGTGVKTEVSIKSGDWSSYSLTERIYSANNSFNFHKIMKVRGYDLFELIGKDNLKTDEDYKVIFVCADGFKIEKTLSELKTAYTYSDFTEKSKEAVGPMLATHSALLADYAKESFAPPISWEDRAITDDDEDKDAPKLMFGQTDTDDMNMSKWGKQIVKIIVGEETEVKGENSASLDSSYKHISYDGAPFNIDSITSATLTIEGPGVKGYRALSLRQIEEALAGQNTGSYQEKMGGKVIDNTYEGTNVSYLLDNFVEVKDNAGDIVFKDKVRKEILRCPVKEASKYMVAYGINGVPLVFLDTDVGYREKSFNDNGCFKLVYDQGKTAGEFSNVAYIYVEEKDAKNIYEHSYAPYNDKKYTDYQLTFKGDAFDKETSFTVAEIEAMKDMQMEAEYSLSNSEYFWYYNTYKGVKLWDLMLKAGIDPNIDENTKVQIKTADNYNFQPMTVKEIKDDSLYGYYEKDPLDMGDGKFDGKNVKPLNTGMPVLVAYGFNGYPYVTRPADEGYNSGLGNDGGPLRIIFGKTDYDHTNGSFQAQFAKDIIVGDYEGGEENISASGTVITDKEQIRVSQEDAWKHTKDKYEQYRDLPVLRVTGSQVKEPITFTLAQLEDLTGYAVRGTYTGDGIHEFEGVVLWELISEVVGLKDDATAPTVRVFSGASYNQLLRSNDQLINGVTNSQGKTKDIILAYAVDGYPLVPNSEDIGYENNNAFGPVRLIIEENKSMWVKWTDCIVVGTGDYEAPEQKDVRELNILGKSGDGQESAAENIAGDMLWLTYKNDTGKELPQAAVRCMEYDASGNLWFGLNGGGISRRSPEGAWTHYAQIETVNAGTLKADTCYAIAQRENGELWFTLGGYENPQGVLVKNGDGWKLFNSKNSQLPSDFVQELENDGKGGLWIGTGSGIVYVDKDDKWTVYDKSTGLVGDSIDAIAFDDDGGVWFGFFVSVEGTEDAPVYKGAYQYMDKDGKLTTYTDFADKSYGGNWVRSISIDKDGRVWVTRSGNYAGQGQAEIDCITDGELKVYKSSELYPGIAADDDIRFVYCDSMGGMYIATKQSGILYRDATGAIADKYSSETVFPGKKWNDVAYLKLKDDHIYAGTNGGAALYTEAAAFNDMKSHWAKKQVEVMATKGYIKGMPEGGFAPEDSITRAQFISMIVRMLGLGDGSTTGFSDVKETDWFYESVAAAEAAGLIDSASSKTLAPNGSITREEMAVIIGKAMKSELSQAQVKEALSKFTDASAIGEASAQYVAAVTAAGIIQGLPGEVFGGGQSATRAQAAVMLLRYLDY